MRQYGLIGKTLGHSFSALYFARKFSAEGRNDCRYELFELSTLERLRTFVKEHPDLQGFNVTIPYKRDILPWLDSIDPEAEEIGAVNTVRVIREEDEVRLVGFNTDAEGFRLSLAGKPLIGSALVLGSGGAAAAVTHTLRQLGVPYHIVSRTPTEGQLSYAQITPDRLSHISLIVNCTPLGTTPDIHSFPPLPYEAITPQHFLYDLVYNPEETAFLREGKLRGARTQNGLQMLYLQADASWRIWNVPIRTLYL